MGFTRARVRIPAPGQITSLLRGQLQELRHQFEDLLAMLLHRRLEPVVVDHADRRLHPLVPAVLTHVFRDARAERPRERRPAHRLLRETAPRADDRHVTSYAWTRSAAIAYVTRSCLDQTSRTWRS